MFLPADMQAALQSVSRPGQCPGRIAALMGVAFEHEVLVAQRLNHIEHGLQVFIFNNRRHCGLAGGIQVPCGHDQHRLANKFHLVDGQ